MRASSTCPPRREPVCLLACACLACLLAAPLLAPPLAAAGADEEISLRGDVFTLPSSVASEKRREARQTGFSLTLGLGAIAGYDSNLYRSPESEEGSALFGVGALLETDSRGGGQNRFESRVTAESTSYPGNPDADVVRVEGGVDYTRPLGGADFEAGFKAAYRNDDATNILGDPYTEDYSYLRWEGDAALTWALGKDHQLRAGARLVLKDYAETANYLSLDWTQAAVDLRYRYRIGEGHSARIQVEAGNQTYGENPSSDANGVQDPAYPKEELNFTQIRLAYSRPLSDRMDLDLSYARKEQDDPFAGYESYSSNAMRLGLDARLGDRTIIGTDASLSSREYEVHPADAGEKLAYNRLSVGATVQHRLGTDLWLTAGGTWYSRDSNLDAPAALLYRDYAGTLVFAGLSRYF